MASPPSSSVFGLVVAAGTGTRLQDHFSQESLPKQYQRLGPYPVLTHTLKALLQHDHMTKLLVVIGEGQEAHYQAAIAALTPHEQDKILIPCLGGAMRQISVANGLERLVLDIKRAGQNLDEAVVLIHDAARPFVDTALLSRLLTALETYPAIIPVLPVTDSLVYTERADDALPHLTTRVSRDKLMAIQTPQAFHLPAILAAHRACAKEGITNLGDDSAVFQHHSGACHAVQGAVENFKITAPQDFARAQRLINARFQDSRTGLGYDVHRFCAGDHVWLGGVKIPHTHSLEGHSDADVLLHAITDALFGALGLPDIGVYFPPSEPQWRGAASSLFLQKALEALRERQGFINNLDATLICEAPKMSPWRTQIVQTIAGLCQMAQERVSIKATTSEGLGFTGRREGIAAQALVTIKLPS